VSKLGEPALEIELLRIAPLPEAAQLRGVSVRTLKRNDPHLIIQVSKRRQGMRVGDALGVKRSA
jgi:hypothetical protein